MPIDINNPYENNNNAVGKSNNKINIDNPYELTDKINSGTPSFDYFGGVNGMGESKFDYNIGRQDLENLGKIRGLRQPWYEQTGAMLQQAVVGEVIGGTLESVGTILAIPEILGGDYSMDNPFMNLGKAIREGSRDLTPIYQTGDRFSDFGFWAQGLVSAASSASMMLPGWGIAKGVEWVTKGLKWGTTAMKIAQTGISALGMRHIEGAREANEVYNQLKQLGLESNQQLKGEFAELKAMEDAEIAALPLQMPNPETGLTYSNEDRINQIREKYNKLAQDKIELAANAGARLTYIADYSNIVFDMLQMGAILKPFSALTRNVGNLGYKVAETAGKLPTSKLGKVGYRLMDTGKYGLIEMTEGIEEQINFISAKEGEREGRVQLGLEKDEDSTFTERLGGYVKEDEFWDSFIFGAIGGVGFKGLMKAAGMDENAGIVNRKIAEIQGREQIIKDRAVLIRDVVSDPNKSPEYKKEFLKSQLKDVGFETGIRSSAAGNVDLLLEWANDPKLADEIASMGFGDVEVIRELMPEFRKGIEQAENLYKKHYTGLYEYNTSEAVKRVLIADRINLDRQIQENLENLKTLEREGIELKTKDNWLQVKGASVENNNMLNQYVNMQTIAQLQKDLQETNTPETKAAIQTVIDNIKQENTILAQEMFKMEKEAKDLNIPFTKPNLEDITAVDNRLIVNMAEQKILRNINNVWVKELENKNKKEVIDKNIKDTEELINTKAKESEELLKANKKVEAEAKARAKQEAANKKKAEEEAKKQGKTQPVDVSTTPPTITNVPEDIALEDAKTKGTQPTDGEFTEEFEAKKANIERRRLEELNTKLVGQPVSVGNLINRPPTQGIIKEVKVLTSGNRKGELGFYANEIGNDVFSNITKTTELYFKVQEINAKYDAELKALEQEETSNENTAKQQNIVDDAHSDVTGNNPEKVIPDNEIQSEEINLYDYKSESSLITGYKATGYTASGTTLAKKTFNYTDISPYALDLSHSKILPDGAEVKLSLETDFDGKVAVYDNGVRVLKEDGTPYYENKTYDQIESSDEKPIKIVYTIGGKEVIIGHLPTVSWANAKDKNDEYENIANDVSRGRDAAAEVEKLRQFRKYIVEQGEDKTYTFKVTKGYGFIVNNLVDGKKVKGTVNQNLPNLTTSGFFTGEFKPFTIFKKGKFKTSKTGNFSTNNILISPETLAKLSKSYNGSVFVMIPSGVDGTFIPKPLEYNTLNESTAKALIHIIKEVSNNNTAVINDIFAKYGIPVGSRAGLRQFLSKFIFLPANTNEGTERIAPRIVFDVQNSRIDVIKNWESVTKVDLNNKKTREASLDKLLPYLTQQKITVREDMLNSNEDFYIPSLKIDEKGNTYIDYSKTTNTKWLQDNLLTDAGELKTSNDSGNKPVYVVQSTLKLNGEIQTVPEKPSTKKDEVAPTPKKSRPKAGKVAKETKTQVNGVDLTTDNINYVKPEENNNLEAEEEAKKADIERRRQEELESDYKQDLAFALKNFPPNYLETVSGKNFKKIFDDRYYSENIDRLNRINAKYDAELAALEDSKGDASISATQRVDIKEGSKSLLITDGDYTFTASNQREVTNEIKSFVYTNLLSIAKEGKRMAVNKAFDIVKKDMQEYLDIFEYLSGLTQEEFNSEEEQAYLKEVGLSHIKSVNDVKRIYEERKRILKPEVWDRFRKEVIQDLKNLGITIKEENLENLTQEQLDKIEGIEDDSADIDIVNTDNQSEKNHSLETFNMDLRNTASINVKLMLSKIADTRHNYIAGISTIPFDSVFEELKLMLSPLDGDIDTYIEAIKEIANNNSSKSYFRNLVRELESEETSTQIKNQFVEVMNTHAGNFMMLLWKKNDKASFIRLVNSNRNSAHNRILENWAENMKYSDITKTNDKNQTIVDADVAKSLVEGVKQADKGSKEEKIAFVKRLFDALGMTVPQSAIDVLVNTEDYKTLIGNNNKGIEGSFEGQFGFTNAGEPYGVFSKLVYSLTEKATKEEVEATEDIIELNNPFIGTHKNSSAEFLARVVALHSKNLFNSSHKSVENKTIWDFSYHIPITSRFKELNKNSVLRNQLKELAFSSTAMYLQEDYASVKLIMNDLDGIKHDQKGQDGITRKNMSDREQEFASIGYFQQQLENSAYYVGLTMSDKTRSPIVEAPKLNIEILPTALNGKYLTREALSPNVRKQIGNLVIAESARIRIMYDKIQEATKNGTLNELKDEVGIQYFEGSQYFYFFPQLNDLVRNEKGELDITKLLNEDLEVLIDSAMDKVVESVNSTIDVWNEIGVVKDGKPILFNNTYRNKHNKYKGDALVAFGAADIDINTLLFNANMMQLVMGDPAKYYNPKKVNGIKDYNLRIQAVMEEYQNREAKDSAPGALGNTKWEIKRGDEVYRGREKYTVAFAEDDTHGSLTGGYLSTLSNYIGKIDRSDAQEYTTVQEKIDVLMNHGKIADDVYVAITEKIKAAGKGGYYTLTKDELLTVLQPDKPVQVYHDITDNNYEHTYYIKSSSFPLIPQLTKDFDIDKVRVAMEKDGVDRLAYVTATKTGARKVTKVFDSNGNVVENLSFKDRVSTLDRKGFAIQQDVPYDAEKKEITLISQMDRLLMQGLSDFTFTWGTDNNVKGSTLKQLKENVRGQLMDLSKDELFKRIGIELKDGSPVFTDKAKLLEALREEAIDRKWSINDIESLEINDSGNVVIPLAFNNSSERIETLITAMFSKIIKQKMHGKSMVQGSSSGFRNNVKTLEDLTTSDTNGIIYAGNKFDPKKGLQFVTHFDGGKTVQKAQVFLPWKFEGKVKDFLVEGTNTLDLTKVDEELLTIIGARIPNQGHSSQLIIEIVGFLPEVMGDLIIVPGEITKQMGSDFDVDKLYTYIYNNIVNDKGQLKKIPSAIDIEGNINVKVIQEWVNNNFKDKIQNYRKFKKEMLRISQDQDAEALKLFEQGVIDIEEISENLNTPLALRNLGLNKEDIRIPSVKKLKREILQNAYIQIHENVLSNPKVVELMTQALDADDLKITGKVGRKRAKRGLFLSRRQQLEDFKMQQEGKSGVSILSRAAVGSAMIEDYDLRLGTYEDGKPKPIYFTGFRGFKLGKLSGLGKSIFNGEIRSKIRNIIIQQSGAVDNSKELVLAINNLNIYTYNASIAITQLSTDEDISVALDHNSALLKQECVYMYIEELSKLSDSLNDTFVPDRKKAAVDAVNKRLQSRLTNSVAVDKTMDFSLEEMQELLTTDETNSENYVKSQLALLEHFIFLDTIGQELSEIYGALSTESKGVGKGYWELAKKQEQYESIGKKTMIIGTDKLLKDNQSGKIYSYVQDAMKVMEQLFPYQTENVKTAINMIESIAGKTRIDADLRFSIWQNMKSYMFSDPTLDTMSKDRTNLFYGENSVAKQLKLFVESAEGKTNLFANKLRYKTATKEGYPDMIFFNAAASERTDEQELVKHFIDMFISDNESTRNLAERLVQYSYATGGVQQALQFVKYVPVAYLKTTNFGSRLIQLSDMLSSETFNTDIFIEQYFQHNPGKARKYNVGDKEVSKISKEGITFDIGIDDITGIQHTVNKEQVPVNFLVVRDVENNKWILLKNTEINGQNIVYKPIPTLGGNGKDYTAYNEYSFGKENTTSTIADNNPEGVVVPVIEPTIVPQPKETNERTLVNKDRTEVMASRYADIYGAKGRKALEFTLSQIQSDEFKPLIPLFLNNSDILPDNFKIVIDNKLTDDKGNLAKGLYDTKTSILSINPKGIENDIKVKYKRLVTSLDIERIIIHELTHAYTSNLYNILKEGRKHSLLTPKTIESFKNIEKLLNVVESKLTPAQKEALKKLREAKYGEASVKDLTLLYGLVNPKEFIAEALTNKEFQEYLNSIEFDSKRSLWDRLSEFLQTIYNEFVKSLGFNVSQNSVLSDTLMETINLIDRTESTQQKTINIYSTEKNGFEGLSNFAERPFEIKGYKFNSVEQAFQEAKYEFTKRTAEDSQIRDNIQNSKSSTEQKKLGSKYPTLDVKTWDSKSSEIMKRIIKLSFEQNPDALKLLLSTGNAILTHTQDNTKWKTEFPKLLMEVREELKSTQPTTTEQQLPYDEGIPFMEESNIYSIRDFVKDNKDKVVTIKYDKYKTSFKAVVTGELEMVSESVTNGVVTERTYYPQFKTNTGKLVTANPYHEVTGLINVDKLTNKSFVEKQPDASISTQSQINVVSLGTTVGEYMKSLTKEERIILRSMMNNNEIKFKCK